MLHARRFALLGALALLVGPFAAGARPVAATSTASVAIHARLCPIGGPKTDIFAECHGNLVPAAWGVAFRVHHRPPEAPDARGNVVIRHLAAGRHILVQVGGPDRETVRVRIWCSVPALGLPARELRSRTVHLNSGDRMVCDWYFIPVGGA
jgi:hypothetical protein